MRILFIVPNLEWGGTEKQLSLLTAGLPARQCQVLVCALGGNGPLSRHLERAGVPFEVLGNGSRLDPRPLWRLWQTLKRFQPDLVHTLRPLGNSLGRWLALRHGRAPVVATAHFPEDVQGSLQQWLIGRLHQRTAAWIVPCQALAEPWQALGVPREKLAVIPPAAAIQTTSSDPVEVRASLGLPAQSRLIVCAGRLIPRKGIKDALWSLDILKYLYDDLYLVVAGDGPQQQRLQQFARDILVVDRVRFVGRPEGIADLTRAADLIWLPSLSDAIPNVLLEAMSAGRPVVASRLPAVAEVVADGETGLLFPPGDKVALARQTRRLLDDAHLAIRLGEAARKRMAAGFRPNQMVDAHLDLYQRVRTAWTRA